MALVCVPITVGSIPEALDAATRAKSLGADLIEFRIDGWYHGEATSSSPNILPATIDDVVSLVSASPLPCILTCRTILEGGQYDGSETDRARVIEAASAAERSPSFIDVELAAYANNKDLQQAVARAIARPEKPGDTRTRLLLSSHDFTTRPPDLVRKAADMLAEPASRVAKVAYRVRSIRDNLELLDLAADAPKPAIALGMGPAGLMSRALAGKFGAFLTFAALTRAEATAPGQPTLHELLSTYRFRQVNRRTKVYGVVGWPVAHSLSPSVHNAGFEAVGHDGVYLPMPVAPEYEALKATLAEFIDHPRLSFSGCAVTIPHKEHLVRFAREMNANGDARWSIDPLSLRCGAANTLIVTRDAADHAVRCEVINTDGHAAAAMFAGSAVRSAAIIGTGGTTRAVAAALSADGWRVRIVSRDLSRAQRLSDELALPGVTPADTVALADEDLGVLINCTPVGMAGGPDPSGLPIDPAILGNLPPHCVVADVVYNPLLTPLLKAAESRGRATVSGLAMFTGQAEEQFQRWTGKPAPQRLFERVARETLLARSTGS